MDTCLDLIALQYTCMIVMAMLAFFVFVSRYYVTCRNRQFEQSRWMIVVALLLFVVHYMCQMRLGWRQQGNDVGVLFNLLFYSPSAILLSWSQLNILRAGHRRWSFMRYGVVGYALMVLCIVAGVEIVTETNDEIAAAKVFREIGPERIAEIDMAVSKWRSEGGFRDSNLTLSSFARRIMVNRTDVASYLTSIYGKNFRTWLSGIRVEEAKALMAAHPEYSNEVVSMECGFSSRVYFQRLFKERTGLTPAEWRRQR